MDERDFGIYEGKTVRAITLRNKNGLRAELISFAATLKSFIIKDKYGKELDVVLGFDNLQGYIEDKFFMGQTIGPVADIIKNAEFELDSKKYTLPKNRGAHHWQGGGWAKRVWEYSVERSEQYESAKFWTVKEDGEYGYPGKVHFEVTYTLDSCDQLKILYEAFNLSDCTTVVNMTNRSYFNLDGTENISEHELIIRANSFITTKDDLTPTGEITQLDGRFSCLAIGVRLGALATEEVVNIDHCFILDKLAKEPIRLRSERSGIELVVTSTNPAAHMYTANAFDGIVGKNGKIYSKCAGISIEPQKYTDAPNITHFPSIDIPAHGKYSETTVHTFRLSA